MVSILIAATQDASARSRKKKNYIFDAAQSAVANALTSAPKDQETCFSPDEPCDLKLVKFIESAQKSLDVAIYDLNRDQIVHHILLASKRIPVRVIVDRRQAQGSHSAVGTLVKAGLAVRFGRQRGIMHNKFTVVDGQMIETGSFNYTNHASEANNENQIYLANPEVVARYKKRFEEIWENAEPVTQARGIAAKHSE